MVDQAKPKQVYTSANKPIWCPGCLVGDTLVVSNPSVKPIKEVKIGDKVLTANGTYKKVAKTIEHHHTGLLYKIRVKAFGSVSATPEHPFVGVRKARIGEGMFAEQKIEAEELKVGDYLVFPIMSEIRDIQSMPFVYDKKLKDTRSKALPESLVLDDRLLRLFGYYIAEGSSHGRSIIFSLSKSETEFIDDIMSIMGELFGLKGSKRPDRDGDGIDIVFYSSYLAEIFKQLFGGSAGSKQIPHDFMFLPKEKQSALLRGLWRGDGYFDDVKAGYATISVVLSEQVKLLLLRQGIVPTVYNEPAHGIHKKAYRIYVVHCEDYNRLAGIVGVNFHRENPGKNHSIIMKNNRVYLPIRSINTSEYDGPVYDLTMDDPGHTFVTNITASGNCGDFGVFAGITKAVTDLGLDKSKIAVVSGIGCSSAMPHSFSTYGIHSLHGRLLPTASGMKLANEELVVIGTGGDGDGYGIGVGHLVHTARRNLDMTYIVMNNEIYGLTTGQASPTSFVGQKTKSTPFGSIETPENPLAIALAAGATYVARAFSGDPTHMAEIIKNGIQHRGFAIIDVFSPCVTFNDLNTYDWYRQRVYKLDQSNHDPSNRLLAYERAIETESTNWNKIPIGVIYKTEKPIYSDLDIVLKEGPLIKQPFPTKEKVQEILKEYI